MQLTIFTLKTKQTNKQNKAKQNTKSEEKILQLSPLAYWPEYYACSVYIYSGQRHHLTTTQSTRETEKQRHSNTSHLIALMLN